MIPSSVAAIEKEAFRDCKNLRRVVFQHCDKLRMIESNCFSGSGLEKFRAPLNLQEIDSGAFYDCRNLRHATLNGGLQMLWSKSGKASSRGTESKR